MHIGIIWDHGDSGNGHITGNYVGAISTESLKAGLGMWEYLVLECWQVSVYQQHKCISYVFIVLTKKNMIKAT